MLKFSDMADGFSMQDENHNVSMTLQGSATDTPIGT